MGGLDRRERERDVLIYICLNSWPEEREGEILKVLFIAGIQVGIPH